MINIKARRQFLLLATNYVFDNRRGKFSQEQIAEMDAYQFAIEEWKEGDEFPSLPEWFPFPELYNEIFKE